MDLQEFVWTTENLMIAQDAYPLHDIHMCLDTLAGAKYLCTLDLASSIWQLGIHKDNWDKTAFVSYKGLFRFKVMPFGLTNAPASFQRLMDVVLRGAEVGMLPSLLRRYSGLLEEHCRVS